MEISKNSRILLIAVPLLAIAVWWAFFRSKPEPTVATISGNIELTEVAIGFKTPGKLARLLVEEGDMVEAGQLIAELDTAQLQHQREMASAALEAAQSRIAQLQKAIAYQQQNLSGATAQRQAELRGVEAQLDELREGSRVQEKERARASLRQATSQREKAESDWQRAEKLFRAEDISAADHDRARAAYLGAKAQEEQGQEQLRLVEEGPRSQTITAASAQVERARAALHTTQAGALEIERLQLEIKTRTAEIDQAKANLAVIDTQLSDAKAYSPIRGVVLTKPVESGEILAAGVTVASIGDLASPWLRGYVNQKDQGRVRLGSDAAVHIDAYPGRDFRGKLTYISAEAEFTPRQIQTAEERSKLVYRVKVLLENPDGILKLNMPADAEIPLLSN